MRVWPCAVCSWFPKRIDLTKICSNVGRGFGLVGAGHLPGGSPDSDWCLHSSCLQLRWPFIFQVYEYYGFNPGAPSGGSRWLTRCLHRMTGLRTFECQMLRYEKSYPCRTVSCTHHLAFVNWVRFLDDWTPLWCFKVHCVLWQENFAKP